MYSSLKYECMHIILKQTYPNALKTTMNKEWVTEIKCNRHSINTASLNYEFSISMVGDRLLWYTSDILAHHTCKLACTMASQSYHECRCLEEGIVRYTVVSTWGYCSACANDRSSEMSIPSGFLPCRPYSEHLCSSWRVIKWPKRKSHEVRLLGFPWRISML